MDLRARILTRTSQAAVAPCYGGGRELRRLLNGGLHVGLLRRGPGVAAAAQRAVGEEARGVDRRVELPLLLCWGGIDGDRERAAVLCCSITYACVHTLRIRLDLDLELASTTRNIYSQKKL